MKTITIKRHVPSLFFFLILIPLLVMSCRKANQGNETPAEPAQRVQTLRDTTGIEQEAEVVPSIEKLEMGKVEVATRLEALLSLIEQKEKSLIDRETRLLEQEASLQAKEKELAKREASFRRQQVISWVVLILGLGGIFFGFILGLKKQRKSVGGTETKTKGKIKDKAEAGATAGIEKNKEKIKAEQVKAESKVEQEEGRKEKSEPKSQPRKES